MFSISANILDDWTKREPRKAQELLPKIIAKLILSTNASIISFNYQIDNAVQYPGYDGVLVSENQTHFFPSGKSVWECGTDNNIIKKYKEDIEKRHDNPLGVDVNDTVFVFVTSRIWNHKKSIEECINESRTIYQWKDIQIIDASRISLWLEQSIVVSVWLEEIMGMPRSGCVSIEQYWADYCLTTTPKLNKDFFLIGRESIAEKLIKWLEKAEGYQLMRADSMLEATLFIIAVIFSSSDSIKERLLNRIAIIDW